MFSEDETMWIVEYDHWPSRLAEDGRWWLRFPFVFSEDEMMWTMIVGPPGWQRMGDGGFTFPLYSVRMKRCGL